MNFLTKWRGGSRRVNIVLAAAAILALGGCDSLVNYNDPDEISPESLAGSSGAQALYAGAMRSFGWAFAGNNGGTEGQALISGMMSDEWFHSGTFSTRVDFDMRAHFLDNSTLEGVFRQMQTARIDALRAIDAMEGAGANTGTDTRFSQMNLRIGATFLFGAMNYCSGIVYSNIVGGSQVPGGQLTQAQMLDSANVYLDKALGGAAGTGSEIHNTAKIMKARGAMIKGDYTGAAGLVAGIPTNFRAINEHSTINGGTENGIYVFNTQNERWSIAHGEGGNGLGFRGKDGAGAGTDPALADPRVPWKRDGGTDVGFDNESPQYDLTIYTARADNSIWAKGEEARLIEAEAALKAGNTATWLQKLNELRATVAGLAPLADPGNATDRVSLLFRERGFWEFAIGTRLSHQRRLMAQYGRSDAAANFPTGAYPKGGNYGPDVNFAVPNRENLSQGTTQTLLCIDRNP